METKQDDTTAAVDAIIEASKSRWANGDYVAGHIALQRLSKVGSKDIDIVRRLAKMMRCATVIVNEFFAARDTLTSQYAKRVDDGDYEGEILTEGEGQQQVPVYRNKTEFDMKFSELQRKAPESELLKDLPKPFTWKELTTKFKHVPDGETLAALGPFAELDD